MGIEQNCVDGILESLRKIQTDYLATKNYSEAADALEFTLFDRNYYLLSQRIALNLHSGMSFNASLTSLLSALRENRTEHVPGFVQKVLAFGAQTHLPAGNPSQREI